MSKHTITVPTDRNEITLMQMIQWEQLKDLSEEERLYNAISMFCDLTLTEVSRIPFKEMGIIRDRLYSVLNAEAKFVDRFELKGVKYGFIPNMDDMSTGEMDALSLGEYVDIDEHLKEPLNEWKIMSVLYRPIIKEGQQRKDGSLRYEIEPYTGKLYEDLKQMPSGFAYGARVFFWDLGIELLNSSLKFLEKEKRKEQQKRTPYLKNGDGLDSYISLLKETLQGWKKLRQCPFIKLFYGELTKQKWQKWKAEL